MPNKLQVKQITAVALCKQGMNPVADIVLYKSIDHKEVTNMTFGEIVKGLPVEQQSVVLAYLAKALPPVPGCPQCTAAGHMCPACQAKAAKAAATATKKSVVDAVTKAIENPTEGIKSEDADIAAIAATVKKSTDELATLKAGTPSDDDVLKGMSEGVRKMFLDMKAKTDAAEKVSKELKDQADDAKYLGIAKSFDKLPTSAEDLGPVLKAVAAANADAFTKVEALLKAANEAITKGNLYKELGNGHSTLETGDAMTQLNTIAKSMIDTDSTLTKEKAFAKACTSNPKLYDQYLNEMEG